MRALALPVGPVLEHTVSFFFSRFEQSFERLGIVFESCLVEEDETIKQDLLEDFRWQGLKGHLMWDFRF